MLIRWTAQCSARQSARINAEQEVKKTSESNKEIKIVRRNWVRI